MDIKEETIGTAVVDVRLRIKLPSTWGKECTIDQVYKQARDDAKNIVRQRIASLSDINIIGEPDIQMFIGKRGNQ